MISKNTLKIFLSLILFSGCLFSNAFAATEPQVLVQTVADETIARIKKDKDLIQKDPKYIHVVINELLIPHFDFETMSQWVLGKYWRSASAEQKKAFTEEFKSLLIRTYANSLLEYTDQTIKYLPFRDSLEQGDVTVRSEVEQPGGFPIPINYKLHIRSADWKVYDITIDDISLIANYRTSFGKEIRKSGLDELIKTLSSKN